MEKGLRRRLKMGMTTGLNYPSDLIRRIIKNELTAHQRKINVIKTPMHEEEKKLAFSFVMREVGKINSIVNPIFLQYLRFRHFKNIPILKQYKKYISYYDPSIAGAGKIIDSQYSTDLIYQMDLLDEIIATLNNMKIEINNPAFGEVSDMIIDLEKLFDQLTKEQHIGAMDQRYAVEDEIVRFERMLNKRQTALKNINLNLANLEDIRRQASELFLIQ